MCMKDKLVKYIEYSTMNIRRCLEFLTKIVSISYECWVTALYVEHDHKGVIEMYVFSARQLKFLINLSLNTKAEVALSLYIGWEMFLFRFLNTRGLWYNMEPLKWILNR